MEKFKKFIRKLFKPHKSKNDVNTDWMKLIMNRPMVKTLYVGNVDLFDVTNKVLQGRRAEDYIRRKCKIDIDEDTHDCATVLVAKYYDQSEEIIGIVKNFGNISLLNLRYIIELANVVVGSEEYLGWEEPTKILEQCNSNFGKRYLENDFSKYVRKYDMLVHISTDRYLPLEEYDEEEEDDDEEEL